MEKYLVSAAEAYAFGKHRTISDYAAVQEIREYCRTHDTDRAADYREMSFLMTLWNAGRVQGIREERTKRHKKNCVKVMHKPDSYDEILSQTIVYMGAMCDHKRRPVALVETLCGMQYHFPVYRAYGIHIFNAFLRQLVPGIETKFTTYAEYEEIIERAFKIYKGVA